MIEKLFMRKIDDEITILLKAMKDVQDGIFTVSQASNFYSISPADLVKIVAEVEEYERWLKRVEIGQRVKYAD